MAPLTPHWTRPSHPDIQEVIIGDEGFTTKSFSKVSLPPFGLFAKMSFPPCTVTDEPTYATVQFGRRRHLELNSDLLYMNHSCEPSLICDTANLQIIAGPKGLKPGEELTFFYPSTEWQMAQPFDCICGASNCRGRISGAKDMAPSQLEGLWINGHIRELLEERAEQQQQQQQNDSVDSRSEVQDYGNGASGNGSPVYQTSDDENTATGTPTNDPTAIALKDAVVHAEKVVAAARNALQAYTEQQYGVSVKNRAKTTDHGNRAPAETINTRKATEVVAGSQSRGPTSRELSGEMDGDTTQ